MAEPGPWSVPSPFCSFLWDHIICLHKVGPYYQWTGQVQDHVKLSFHDHKVFVYNFVSYWKFNSHIWFFLTINFSTTNTLIVFHFMHFNDEIVISDCFHWHQRWSRFDIIACSQFDIILKMSFAENEFCRKNSYNLWISNFSIHLMISILGNILYDFYFLK